MKIKHNYVNYWQEKLHINYKEELEIYKRICGLRYKNKLVRAIYPLKSNLITYEEWKQNVICKISTLNINELHEYSRFLNQIIRDNEITFSLSQSLLIPLVIFMTGEFAELLIMQIEGILVNEFAIKLIIILSLFISVLWQMRSVKEEPVRKNFYNDIKEIVDEYIASLNQFRRVFYDKDL